MNHENMLQWADELESGKYTQTTGSLRRRADSDYPTEDGDIGFCCLGVAADISCLGRWVDSGEDGMEYHAPEGEVWSIGKQEQDFLNVDIADSPVSEWLGMPDGYVSWNGEQTPQMSSWYSQLISLNDFRRLDFEGIAEEIRRQVKLDKERLAALESHEAVQLDT